MQVSNTVVASGQGLSDVMLQKNIYCQNGVFKSPVKVVELAVNLGYVKV